MEFRRVLFRSGNSSSFLFALYGFIAARTLPRRMQGAAFGLAIVGTGLMLGSSYELSPRHFAGDLFAILAGFFYFLYLVVIYRARMALPPIDRKNVVYGKSGAVLVDPGGR